MTWNWDSSLLEKFIVNVQRATMKYEIIRKPMVLENVEVNLLKSVPLLLEAEFADDPLFNKLQRSKWEGLWNLAEIEVT